MAHRLQLPFVKTPSSPQEYEDLAKQHLALESSHRHLLEDFAQECSAESSNCQSDKETLTWIAKYMTCADQVSKAGEDCRQLKLIMENSGDLSFLESKLSREVVDLVIKEQSACRRVEMSERAKNRAEEGLREADVSTATLFQEYYNAVYSDTQHSTWCVRHWKRNLRSSMLCKISRLTLAMCR